MGIIKKMILDMIYINSEYRGTGMYMALYFATVLILLFYDKKERYRKAIVVPSLIIFGGITFLLPVANYLVHGLYDNLIRGRYPWLFMVPGIAAFGCALLVCRLETNKKQALAVLLLVPVLFFCGTFKLSNAMYQKAENPYRLPQSTIEICDQVLSMKEEPCLIVPYEIADGFRQYSTRVHLLYGENAKNNRIKTASKEYIKMCDEMQTSMPDLNYINQIARRDGVDFIVFDSVYHAFGNGNLLELGDYEESPDFVGDRTPDVNDEGLYQITVTEQDGNRYFDLTSYGLSYVGTFGQYLLYCYE